MERRYLSFFALAVSVLYGVGFAAFDDRPQWYTALGAAVVCLSWVAVGVFGKEDGHGRDRQRNRNR
ncbi:hypothetical protein ACMYYO_14765 [Dermacoccaceae bacterium W4C1]